jgi:hypothetical protein
LAVSDPLETVIKKRMIVRYKIEDDRRNQGLENGGGGQFRDTESSASDAGAYRATGCDTLV